VITRQEAIAEAQASADLATKTDLRDLELRLKIWTGSIAAAIVAIWWRHCISGRRTHDVRRGDRRMRNPRYKGINPNRIHRGKVKLRRFTSCIAPA
jgi:hypothetical protein